MNEFQDLEDKNAILKYSIEKNASLSRLGEKISAGMGFQMPDGYRLVKVENNQQAARNGVLPSEEDLLSRIFGIKREAQAKTTNP